MSAGAQEVLGHSAGRWWAPLSAPGPLIWLQCAYRISYAIVNVTKKDLIGDMLGHSSTHNHSIFKTGFRLFTVVGRKGKKD